MKNEFKFIMTGWKYYCGDRIFTATRVNENTYKVTWYVNVGLHTTTYTAEEVEKNINTNWLLVRGGLDDWNR